MPTRTQIFQVSTLYGAATLAAALDAGRFGPGQDSHRVLLVSNNAAIPETALRLEEMRGYGDIAARFDSVVDWNDAISPHHPSGWGPRSEETELWQRAFRLAWGIDPEGPVDLAVESIQVNPARALAAIFSESAVHVYADGLMSYGPTRNKVPAVHRLPHPAGAPPGPRTGAAAAAPRRVRRRARARPRRGLPQGARRDRRGGGR